MSVANSLLTEEEILDVINTWDESEDDFDDDEFDLEYYGSHSCEELNDPLIFDDQQTVTSTKSKTVTKKTSNKIKTQNVEEKNQPQKKNASKKSLITWKHSAFANKTEEVPFKGDSTLPSEILEMETPYQFFKYFFTDAIIDKIVEQSLLFSKQSNPENSFNVTSSDIKKWIGICYVIYCGYKTTLVTTYW